MSKAGDRLIKAATEALAISRGEQMAARATEYKPDGNGGFIVHTIERRRPSPMEKWLAKREVKEFLRTPLTPN